MDTPSEQKWIDAANNLGITCSLQALQNHICECPATLYHSALYIFFCGIFMGRAMTEDVGNIDVNRAPYTGPGAVEAISSSFLG